MDRKSNDLNEPTDDGQDVPMPSESTEKGPYRYPEKQDDPDVANDEPADDDDVDEDMDEDETETDPDGAR